MKRKTHFRNSLKRILVNTGVRNASLVFDTLPCSDFGAQMCGLLVQERLQRSNLFLLLVVEIRDTLTTDSSVDNTPIAYIYDAQYSSTSSTL